MSSWLPGRDVLIQPSAVGKIHDAPEFAVEAALTRAQVENSPGVQTDPPVSQQLHLQYHRHLNWPYQWHRPSISKPWLVGRALKDRFISASDLAVPSERERDPHLHSTREVTGYRLHAWDGTVGRVEDFLLDAGTWSISYLVISTGHWLAGRRVLVPSERVASIRWSNSTVDVNLNSGALYAAPEYDLSLPMTSDFESKVQAHYSRYFWSDNLAA